MIVTIAYILYLAIAIAFTVWVARTLSGNGEVFLVECFGHDEVLAKSTNHLLVVGFYLINIGYITLALKYGDKPRDAQAAFEFLSTKIGLVLLILGGMHFFNIFNFAKLRRKGRRSVIERGAPLSPLNPLPVSNASVEAMRTLREHD